MQRVVRFLSVVTILAVMTAHGATITTFTGGDVGEGLDLEGAIVYALNSGGATHSSPQGTNVTVRGVTFVDDYWGGSYPAGTVPWGLAIDPYGVVPEFGGSADDDALESVCESILYRRPTDTRCDYRFAVNVGWKYKVQAILSENWHNPTHGGGATPRYQDIMLYSGETHTNNPVAAGRTIYDWATNVSVVAEVGYAGAYYTGLVVTMEFEAVDPYVYLWSPNPSNPPVPNDLHALYSAVTVEELSAPSQVSTFSSAADLHLRNGNAVYAVNMSGGASAISVNGVDFLPCGASGTNVPNVTVLSMNAVDSWGTGRPEYGSTANDDSLEEIMHDIRWSPAPGTVNVDAAVIPGKTYDLTLLFSENHFNAVGARVFDITVEGYKTVDEFDILAVTGGWIGNPTQGVEVKCSFVADDDNLDVDLTPGTTPIDNNPILNAFVLSVQSGGTVFVVR